MSPHTAPCWALSWEGPRALLSGSVQQNWQGGGVQAGVSDNTEPPVAVTSREKGGKEGPGSGEGVLPGDDL